MTSGIVLRPPTPEDRPALGRILFDAFHDIATRHGFPPDFATPQQADALIGFLIPTRFGVVAERDGRLLGSNFLAEDDAISAVGPISVDPELQEAGLGRQLMQAVIDRGNPDTGIRLVQDAFNATSMALYASMGFDVREPLALFSGRPAGAPPPAFETRPMEAADVPACADLCVATLGVSRRNEIERSLRAMAPFVALQEGAICAYATSLEFWPAAHGVAASADAFRALLLGVAAQRERPLSFLLPTRQGDLFRFCLAQGLRILKPMTLMSLGPYTDPAAPFFPSVGY